MSLIGSSMSGGNLVPSSSSKNCRSPLCRKVFFIVHIVKSNFTFYKSCCLGFLNVRAEYARGGGARSGRSGRLFSFSQTLPNRKPRGAWKWVIERPAAWAGGLSRSPDQVRGPHWQAPAGRSHRLNRSAPPGNSGRPSA